MIKIIYAKSLNDVIGVGNKLPWHLPSELKIFKEKTLHHTVVMGRRTFDSLPASFKPLKDRKNVVITKDYNFSYPGVDVVNNPMEYLISHFCKEFRDDNTEEDIWVIGGMQIFRLALQFAGELHITNIMKEYEGDVFAPAIDKNKFRLVNSSETHTDNLTNTDYYIDVYRRY